MESRAVCVLVLLAAVANTRAANLQNPILLVDNSRSMSAQQWNIKDAERKTNFGYAYNGQAAANVLNTNGHMVAAWSYLNPEGALVQTSYAADVENGFHVVVNNSMSERSCYTMEGRLGSCMSLLSCYPTSMLPQLSHLETWTVMTRAACNYIERDGTQTHGVCCHIKQSFDESGDMSHTGKRSFIPPVVELSNFNNPTVASPLMVSTKEMLRMPAQKPSSLTQLEKVVLANAKIGCGVGPAEVLGFDDNRIVGGVEAVKNSWPGIVALKRWGRFTCGGFLIAPDKVLTAAHCIASPLSWFVWQYTVELGGHVLRPSSDASLWRKVKRVEIHKDFINTTLTNDIAILTLNSPVTYTKEISPFCLPPANTADDYANQEAVIIGWGSMMNQWGPMPNVLRQAKIKIMSNAECKTKYEFTTMPILNTTMCASAFFIGSCFGDSGGPMLARSSPTAPWTAVGIVSGGVGGCANLLFPTIFARLSSFSDWILDRI